MKILNFGSCNIDFVYSVPHIVSPGETVSSVNMEKFPGGKGLNQSVALAKSGGDVFHAGKIGTDGLFLKELLQKSGVNTKYLEVCDTPTGNAIIQVDKNGENSIVLFGGANQKIDRRYISAVLNDFSAGDILLLQNEISNTEYIIETAYRKGLKIVLNPSPFDEKMRNIDLDKIFVLILNEVEAYGFSGESEKDKICDWFLENHRELNVMLTLGKNGCVYISGGKVTFCPAFEVETVDTTSAGDTFTGYFITGLAENMPIDEVLKRASAASAIAVSRKGAAVSIPMQTEVYKFLKKLESTKTI